MAENFIGTAPTRAANVNFGDIMNQGLDRLAQNEEKARLEEERKRKRDQEFGDRYGIDEELYTLPDTEFRTVNDAATEAVSMYRDRYYEIYKQLKNDPDNVDLKKRLGKINNSVKMLSAANTKMGEIGEKYVSMLENDELSGVDEDRVRGLLESTDAGRVKIIRDSEDNAQYLFYDKDGQLEKVVPFNELIRDDIIKRIDLPTQMDDLVKAVKRTPTDTSTGGFIKTTDVFGKSQQEFVNDWIDSYLGTDKKSLEKNDVLADLLNQATGGASKKRNNFTEQERGYVRNFLEKQVRGRFDEEVKLKRIPQPSSRPTATELKQPKVSDINVSYDGENVQRDSNDRIIFTIGKNIEIDPTKSDRKIDSIKLSPDGSVSVEGEDTVKVKGVQDQGLQGDAAKTAVAEREKVAPNMIQELLQKDGSVQYYKRVPFSSDDMSPDQRAKVLNKVGNIFGVQDAGGLKTVLYQDMVGKFGKETADKIINAKKTTAEEPKKEVKDMTPAEKLEYYRNLK